MQSVARTLSADDIENIAQFYAGKHSPLTETIPRPASNLIMAGQRLAEVGTNAVPACFGCHGTLGNGNGAKVPAIAGQPARFVIARLNEFRDRAKASSPKPGSMTAVASAMTDTQIEEVAAYLSVTQP
jgi:cytochrome c553